jgi:hypothetical protein
MGAPDGPPGSPPQGAGAAPEAHYNGTRRMDAM